MREIKFRAWDGKRMRFFCFPKEFMNCSEDYDFDLENLIWMQYTGLKDKNDKEIYESDLIHHQGTHKKVVTWNDLRCAWNVQFPQNSHHIKKVKIEVIGNKFENPKLLDKPNK